MSAAEWSEAVKEWRKQRPKDAAKEAWDEAGCPGRRECLECGEIFEAPPLPKGGRKVVGWRLETAEEAEERVIEAAKRRAERQTPDMFQGERND